MTSWGFEMGNPAAGTRTLTYLSGTVVQANYRDGAIVEDVRVTQRWSRPVEDSLVGSSRA